MKRCFALAAMAALSAAGTAFADVTIRQEMDIKLNVPMPDGAMPAGLPFNGPTEIVSRVKGQRSYANLGKVATIMDSGTNQVIVMDTEGKRYAVTSMADYVNQISQMTKLPTDQMPEAARQMLQNIQFKADSRETGRSEKIQGIDTTETELSFSITIPLPVPMPGGNGNGLEFAGKFLISKPKPGEMERVPALRELSSYYDQSRKLGNDVVSMMARMFGAVPGLGDKVSTLVDEFRKGGNLTMRMHGEFSVPGMAAMMAQAKANGATVPSIPDGPLAVVDTHLKEINTDAVPDSAFQIPEGYQKGDLADIMKAFTPGAK
ncbi:MAG TPA: hypothetical protein VKB88_05260 [Bryobacteraceae bacterium]|nr:hypothetical protein [Bryobacteraceae bacterium]